MMMSSARRKVGWHVAAVLAVLLLSAAAPVMAQQLTGNVYGYVADEQGGRLPGVKIGRASCRERV